MPEYRPPPLPTTDRARTTEELIARRETDLPRWANVGSLATQWDARAELASTWIPAGARVLDLGCGAMALRAHLAPNCTYFPADVVARSPDCQVVDLNSRQFPSGRYDYVTLLGVLEYIHDCPWVLTQIRNAAPNLIVTYCTATSGDIKSRRGMGWVNDFTDAEFRSLIVGCGWKVGRHREVKRSATNIQLMYCCDQANP